MSSGETYFERYAESSSFKNREFRALVAGDDKPLMEELNKSCLDFQNMVRSNRQYVTEEQLLGDLFAAREVEGSLVDRKNTYQGCIDRIVALSDGTATLGVFEAEPRKSAAVPKPDKPNDEDDPKKGERQNNKNNPTINNKPNQTDSMKNVYPFIMAAASLHALCSDE